MDKQFAQSKVKQIEIKQNKKLVRLNKMIHLLEKQIKRNNDKNMKNNKKPFVIKKRNVIMKSGLNKSGSIQKSFEQSIRNSRISKEINEIKF